MKPGKQAGEGISFGWTIFWTILAWVVDYLQVYRQKGDFYQSHARIPPFSGAPSNPMPCQMTFHDLLLSVRLGWPKEERTDHQQVAVTLCLTFPEPPLACQTDQLADTICYHTLTEALKEGIRDKSFRLIECLAETLYQLTQAFLANPETRIQVHVTKKPAIAGLTGGVTFSYGERG